MAIHTMGFWGFRNRIRRRKNQKNLINLVKSIGTIDKIKRKKVKIGRQYSSTGYKPNKSCFHLAVSTEKQATSGFIS